MKKLLALLLAIAMLATLCACGKKGDDEKGVANKPEAVAEAFVEAQVLNDVAALFDLYAYDYEAELQDDTLSQYDSEEEFFEWLSEECDEKITSWKAAYRVALKQNKEDLKDQYGSDYKIKIKASDTVDLDEEELEEVKEDLLDYDEYIDADKVEEIEEAKEVTVDASISGEDGEEESSIVVVVVKYDGKWKVADYRYDDYDDDYDDDYYGDYPTYEDEY